MITSIFDSFAAADLHRAVILNDPASGLRAIIALDSVTLGPACGGIRTKAYATEIEALADAARLARAMSMKCAIAGLAAGGAKAIVIDHPGLNRPAAFRRLGEAIEDLAGLYRAAGDLGTSAEDLGYVGEKTGYVNQGGGQIAAATAKGLIECINACARVHDRDVEGLRVAVQGAGLIGSSVARALVEAGATVFIADLDEARAQSAAASIGCTAIAPESVLSAPVDIVSPCAIGGVITEDVLSKMNAWAICGAANNQLADAKAEAALTSRAILYVPDFLASAGGVVDGVANMLGGDPADKLISRLGETALELFEISKSQSVTTVAAAEHVAHDRLQRARAKVSSSIPAR
jgi:glutamate dehydrogenase/leucine dehydrogenase